MKTAALRRKLTAWDRYAHRLEKLGQKRIYNAHIYYIACAVLNHPNTMIQVGPPTGKIEGYKLDCCNLDEIVKEASA